MSDIAEQSIKIQHLYRQALSLLVYRHILDEAASRALLDLLRSLMRPPSPENEADILQAYGQWFYAANDMSPSWQNRVETQILAADNPFTRQAQHHDLSALPQNLVEAARHDLNILQQWAIQGPQWVQAAIAYKTTVTLPILESSSTHESDCAFDFAAFSNWADALPALVQHYGQEGIGLFAQYKALRWRNSLLEGIDHPDTIQLSDLVGYDWQQMALKQNTEALLAGYTALNVLLYGSRGSGKSALIKALMNEYGDRGLRLIELNKADMIHLPQVTERLRTSPLKFVIFIDDLSFEEEEDAYKALKVVLEGNLTARPQNVAMYATSNRRHLIREFFGDRPRPSNAEEIHAWDTFQEKLSLSDRFGLTLTFEPATQETYLQIVHHLAERSQINVRKDELTHQALQWAVRQNVRSGRTARQFIDHLRGQQALTRKN
ncbi:MAG: ATP-binding protein [Acaryochloridaceae cyanobacterium RU_4_10]|nr:ATP-binding protein [Acaryochloridaceae cyanobacterium RU_4_10]